MTTERKIKPAGYIAADGRPMVNHPNRNMTEKGHAEVKRLGYAPRSA